MTDSDTERRRDEWEQTIGRELRALVLSWNMGYEFATALKHCEPDVEADRQWGALAWKLQRAMMDAVPDLLEGFELPRLRVIRDEGDAPF